MRIVHFYYLPTFQTLSEAPFCANQGRFLRLELSRGTTIATEIGQDVVDLKVEVR